MLQPSPSGLRRPTGSDGNAPSTPVHRGARLLFLVGVGVEWAEAFHFAPPSSGFGTILFTLTGIHATHVLSGILVLLSIYRLGRSGRLVGGEKAWPVEGEIKYWHLVDVAWVFIYPTLYLVS